MLNLKIINFVKKFNLDKNTEIRKSNLHCRDLTDGATTHLVSWNYRRSVGVPNLIAPSAIVCS